MKFSLFITASKLAGFVVLIFAFVLDLMSKQATAFMFAIPFVAAMILGKQYFDTKKVEK